jgi:hypothetical protein
MHEEKEVSFPVSARLHEVMKRLAESRGIELSDVMRDAVEDFVYGNARKTHWGDEKRKFSRSRANIPAVLEIRTSEEDESVRSKGTIIDISMGGVRISIAGDQEANQSLMEDSPEVLISFRVPGEESELCFKCRPVRAEQGEDGVRLGVSFSDGDFNDMQVLHRYVM